jgi:hypothetical protein
VRSDIRANLAPAKGIAEGILLTLTIEVVAVDGCTPLEGYAVYVWQCDRESMYSMYTKPEANYLRGVQATDAKGRATFTTIFPGCYPGRWPHIHFEVFPSLKSITDAKKVVDHLAAGVPGEELRRGLRASGVRSECHEPREREPGDRRQLLGRQGRPPDGDRDGEREKGLPGDPENRRLNDTCMAPSGGRIGGRDPPAPRLRLDRTQGRRAPRVPDFQARPPDRGDGAGALIQRLYEELAQKGLQFKPPCELGDEWFVPVGLPVIFVPFYLAHDRLRHLEKKLILEVEGGAPEAFMRLIRHEAAHAYSYAYKFVHRTKWRQMFGKSSTEETPSFYRPAAVQPELRRPPRRLVRAVAPRRGLRRDVRRVAHARDSTGAPSTADGGRSRSSSTSTS